MNHLKYAVAAVTLLGAISFIIAAVLLVFQLHRIQPDSENIIKIFSDAEFSTSHTGAGEKINLPHDWHMERLNFSQLWYRFYFSVSPVPTELYALYLPVISENAVAYINGIEIGNGGSIVEPIARNWAGPLIFPIGSEVLKDGRNELMLQVFSEPIGRGLLPVFYFGKWTDLVPSYDYRKMLKRTALGAFMIVLIAGAFILFLIAYQRTEPSEFSWAGATFLGLAGRLLHVFFQGAPVPIFLWEWWLHICLGFTIVCISLFVNRYFKLQMRVVEISSAIFIFALSIVTFTFVRTPELQILYFNYGAGVWGIACLAVGIVPIGLAFSIAIRRKNKPALYVVCVGCVMFTLGIHDMLMVNGILTRENGYLLHYATPLVVLLLSAILVSRLIETSSGLEELNVSLEQRVEESNKALVESYEKVQKMERDKILTSERERFNREMHDGLGGHLSTALALAELDVGADASLTRTIRDATDEMRLMLDTAEAMGEDIGMIIGSLRAKLQRQVEAGGFRLIWRIEDTSPINTLDHGTALSLIRIVQEAVTNALKHSGGDTIRVTVREANHFVVLAIEDNGNCVNLGSDSGHGIPNIKRRAEELGAEINFEVNSEFGGLAVKLSVEADGSATHRP